MGVGKPVLGYPSRTAAVLALRDQGMKNPEIASRIGIDGKTVAALLCNRGQREGGVSQPATPRATGLIVPADVVSDLRAHAMRRSISVDRLILTLLERIAIDGLVDAVLDDAVPAA